MPKPVVVSVYNFKGGVGKTTASYNIAYILSQVLKLRVLLVDADPQDNLTGIIKAHDFMDVDKARAFENEAEEQEKAGEYVTLGNLFSDILDNIQPQSLERAKRVKLMPVHDYKDLFLLPGHNSVGKLDRKLSVGIEGGPMSVDLPGYISNLLREVGRLNKIDIILVDLNPGFGDFNCSMMMGSDYFIVPFCAEYSSLQAIQSLQRTMPEWYEAFHQEDHRRRELGLIKTIPKFLGAFPQKIHIQKIRKQERYEMVQAYGTWVKVIYEETDKLVDMLRKVTVSIRDNKKEISMLAPNFNLNKFVGVIDFVSTGMDVQVSGKPISDVQFPHRHLVAKKEDGIQTKTFTSNQNDKKMQALDSFKRVVGECFKNLTEEDSKTLEDPANPFAVRVHLFSHIAENIDVNEYIPPPQTPVHEEQDQHWYEHLEINRLLIHYFKNEVSIFRAGAVSLEELNSNPFMHAIQDMHQRVAQNQEITRGVLPINVRGNHWVLLYFIFPTRDNDTAEIYYFDPFGVPMPKAMASRLEEFYPGKAVTNLEGRVQEDGFNCGPWVVEAARAMAVDAALPERGFDINARREEHKEVIANTTAPAPQPKSKGNKRKAVSEPDVEKDEKAEEKATQRKRARVAHVSAVEGAPSQFFRPSQQSDEAGNQPQSKSNKNTGGVQKKH